MSNMTLERAEEAFCKWRAERISRIAPIPDTLWRMALTLYPQYKRVKICRTLKLSGGQFKRRLEDAHPKPKKKGFVLASKDKSKATLHINQDVQLIIQGKERMLTLCVGMPTLSQVLSYIERLI